MTNPFVARETGAENNSKTAALHYLSLFLSAIPKLLRWFFHTAFFLVIMFFVKCIRSRPDFYQAVVIITVVAFKIGFLKESFSRCQTSLCGLKLRVFTENKSLWCRTIIMQVWLAFIYCLSTRCEKCSVCVRLSIQQLIDGKCFLRRKSQ